MAERRSEQAVEWLLREGGREQAVPASSRMTFEDEHWTASIERIDIGEALRVFLVKAEIRRSLSLEPMQSVPGVWLASDIAIKGRVAVSLTGGPRIRLSPDRSMLCRPKDGKALFTPQPRQSLLLAGYMLRADRVVSLCDGDVPEPIRPLIACEVDRGHLLDVPATGHLRGVATRMHSEQFGGTLRPVWLEGLALQLFAIQCAAVGAGAASAHALTARERSAVEEARERLLRDMRSPPTAAALAAAVGMSERRLNAGFREMFGATIFEALRNERLEHARLVLEAKSLPMKVVAERVGYRHVTNFISAFTARYGHPPREFVRGRAGEASASPPQSRKARPPT